MITAEQRAIQRRENQRIASQPSTQTTRPSSMKDIGLRAGQRGIILGMTRVGKSTLAEQLIEQWRQEYPRSRTIVLDSKPRFRAEWELHGVTTKLSRRYSKWDWGETIPGSVVLPLGADVRQEIKFAWSQGFQVIIAQVTKRSEIARLDYALQCAYEDRSANRPLFIYTDELNNFFRGGTKAGNGIVMALTSGGERSVAFLGAAQRPRHISVEAMESMTNLYWFYTPFTEDVKHLKNMGVPGRARPPQQYYQFYFFNRMTRQEGLCHLTLKGKKNG